MKNINDDEKQLLKTYHSLQLINIKIFKNNK